MDLQAKFAWASDTQLREILQKQNITAVERVEIERELNARRREYLDSHPHLGDAAG